MENRNIIQKKINKIIIWFFEKVNKTEKFLGRLIKQNVRRLKSLKSGMTEKTLLLNLQDYKGIL